MKRIDFRRRRSTGKISPRLVTLSSSVILAAYAAGWAHVRHQSDTAPDATGPTSLLADVARASVAPVRTGDTVLPPVASGAATPNPQVIPEVVYRDGTYSGSGENVHGGVTVGIVISGGQIVSAQITRCYTRYPCSEIESLPAQVIERQSARLRYVTGATDSSRAFVQAVAAALARASS